MTQRFTLHPTHPQARLLRQAAEVLGAGGLVAMPTDACYVLACRLGDKAAVDRLRAIRGLDERHLLTLMCRDLSELSSYAMVDNRQYRFLKEWAPGPYTFVLNATKEVPRRLWHPSRRTIGLRVPDAPVAQGLLEAHGEPVLCSSLILPDEDDLPPTPTRSSSGWRVASISSSTREGRASYRPRSSISPATSRSWCAWAAGASRAWSRGVRRLRRSGCASRRLLQSRPWN